MDPVSMIRRADELILEAERLLGAGGGTGNGVDAREFEAFRAGALQFVDLLFDSSHPRCQAFVGQEGRASAEAAREDLAILKSIRTELHYFREMGH